MIPRLHRQDKPRQGLALASLTIAVVSFFTLGLLGIGAVVGIVIGIVVLKKIKDAPMSTVKENRDWRDTHKRTLACCCMFTLCAVAEWICRYAPGDSRGTCGFIPAHYRHGRADLSSHFQQRRKVRNAGRACPAWYD